jgi:GST-like protein
MIDIYSWPTPNGHKVHIMLEEAGLPYRVHGINIRTGDQFKPEFLKISPNNRIPAIVDHDGPNGKPISLFESGAILIYLAGKTGKFLPSDLHQRYAALQWLMWQMGGIGPMFGQANHFRAYSVEKITYAIERYTNEANRLTHVMNKRLAATPYLAGDEYSVADIAVFPWMRNADRRGINMPEYPHVERWFNAINARPAVVRALQVLSEVNTTVPHDEKSRDILFGKTQFQRR